MLEVIAIGSDNLVRLDKLKDASTGDYVNTATVSFVLKNAAGGTVVASTSMAYVASSDGRYEGTIPAATSLTENAPYSLEITATQGGTTLFRKVSCVAKYRSNK